MVAETPPHDPYEAFRHAPYRRYAAGMAFVQIAMAMQSVAIAWEIYVRTDSAMALGMVGLVQAIPMLLFTLPGALQSHARHRRRGVLTPTDPQC